MTIRQRSYQSHTYVLTIASATLQLSESHYVSVFRGANFFLYFLSFLTDFA